MSTKGRLMRSFPASAVDVPFYVAGDPDFRAAVAQKLALMSHQPVPGLQPQVKKAGKKHDEQRDTTDPAMVSELLDGFLMALGAHADVQVFGKYTREDVLWENAKLPWRRSPVWLLLRVSLQSAFNRLRKSVDEGRILYKMFTMFFMSHILRLSKPVGLETDLLHSMNAKLARCLLKLGSNADLSVVRCVREIMEDNSGIISLRWAAIAKDDDWYPKLTDLAGLDFERDREYDLPGLREFIKTI